ncbi:hypothetical protein ERN12_05925 [Rhodobacteraceae bacterium]|nr:hypothetical protein ERN12_05925 [Paracoccaceae bacterium]
MADPYALAWLNDLLKIGPVQIDLQRNEETSGAGSGQFWAAELADPLWTVRVDLAAGTDAEVKRIEARLRRLGSNGVILFKDPKAVGLPYKKATIAAINGDRDKVRFGGLPQTVVIPEGTRFSVTLPSGQIWYAETYQSGKAGADGRTALIEVFPYPPMSLATGAAVELTHPHFKATVTDRTPFTYQPGAFGQGATLTLLQKP